MRLLPGLVFFSALMWSQTFAERKELVKVTGRVYAATGYAVSNVLFVITGSSVVVIDTTESMAAARKAFDEFRKVSQLPVSHIIYTHFHGDHINGAKVFAGPDTKIIAQARFTEELGKYRLLGDHNRRLNAIQFGTMLPREQRGISLESGGESGYLPPTITFEDKYAFEEGGVPFELYHTTGETYDHLMVWLPREKALFPGDLFYQSFPMLASPMKPDRPVTGWADSLERMRKLQPEYLVGSHNVPLRGAAEIDSTLANYAKAIRFVHDETVKRINQGKPVWVIHDEVKLPEELASLPYLKPGYGTVEWSINGIFRQYTGWYDMNPTDLKADSKHAFYREVVGAGGSGALLTRVSRSLDAGNNQLVLELTEAVLSAEPANAEARRLRTDALNKLGDLAANAVERNIYRGAAFQLAAQRPKPAERPVVTLTNGKVQLGIDRLGGSITQFQFSDQGLNPLVWANAGPANEARAMGHFICLDRWGQPSKAEEKNGMPFHGEATRVEWTVESSNTGFARMSAMLPMAQLRVRRYARLHASEPLAIIIETITNENKLTRPFNLVQHATVGPPFLDETVLVDSNAGKGFAQSAPDATPFNWPAAMKGPQKVDMRRLKDDPDPNVVSYVIDEPIGWATAANPGKGLLIGYIWKTTDYPWLNFWRHVENGKPLARGLEFGTTGLHQPFPILLDKGRMLGKRLFGILDAGETQTRSYATFLVKIPSDFKGVGRVRYSGTQITVQEQGTQGRIFLLNAGPAILDAAIE